MRIKSIVSCEITDKSFGKGRKRMTTGISFADRFQCINSACTYNCCGGWQIELDEETYLKYLHEEGAFGKELRRHMCFRNVAQIKQRFGKCPYLTKDRLCGMYLKHGEEYMSFACRTFPRRKIVYKEEAQTVAEELYLELSCPEVARLFWEEEDFIHFDAVCRETEDCWEFVVEEREYFEILCSMRETIRRILMREDIPFLTCMLLAFDYAEECQQLSMRLQYQEIIPFSEKFLEEEQIQNRIREYRTYPVSFTEKGRLLHKFVAEGVEQFAIRWTNPGMAKVLKHYYRCFERKNYSQFGKLFVKYYSRMLAKQPHLERKYRNYFLYYVSQRLLYAIQSYNMTKSLIMGIVHTQMLLLFHVVVWKQQREKLTDRQQEDILAYYSRTAGHNEAICDKLYEYISKSADMKALLEHYVL